MAHLRSSLRSTAAPRNPVAEISWEEISGSPHIIPRDH